MNTRCERADGFLGWLAVGRVPRTPACFARCMKRDDSALAFILDESGDDVSRLPTGPRRRRATGIRRCGRARRPVSRRRGAPQGRVRNVSKRQRARALVLGMRWLSRRWRRQGRGSTAPEVRRSPTQPCVRGPPLQVRRLRLAGGLRGGGPGALVRGARLRARLASAAVPSLSEGAKAGAEGKSRTAHRASVGPSSPSFVSRSDREARGGGRAATIPCESISKKVETVSITLSRDRADLAST